MNSLSKLTQLTKLKLKGTEIENVKMLLNLTSLIELKLRECKNLKDVSGIEKLTNLTALYVGCDDEIYTSGAVSHLHPIIKLYE